MLARTRPDSLCSAAMARVVVNIPHIVWREGRPRFVPGPSMRALGFRSRDLKTDDGRWFTLDESMTESAKIAAEAARRRKGAHRPRPQRRPPPATFALGNMVAGVFSRPEFHGQNISRGRRHRRPLKPSTVRDYLKTARIVETYTDIWSAPPGAISPKIARGFIDRVEEDRGLAQARKVRALLSMCYARARQPSNPFRGIELPLLIARPKDIIPADMTHLITCADAMGRPEIGDMIHIGLFTAQRQADRFSLRMSAVTGDRLTLTQAKTGAAISLDTSLALPLVRRLNAALARRRTHKVQYDLAVIDEHRQRPWHRNMSHYRHIWRQLTDTAAEARPILKGFREYDLRKVAMSWLHNAGATDTEAGAVSGHAESSVAQMKKHYVHRNAEQADHALAKLMAWLETKGARL